MEKYGIGLRRVYEAPQEEDGLRVMVDRLWPRGVSKERAFWQQWAKEVAPTPELRTWFGHQTGRFEEFRLLYLRQLDTNPAAQALLEECRRHLKNENVTLVYAARDPVCNHAQVLLQWLNERL